jgi:hypothetical protein
VEVIEFESQVLEFVGEMRITVTLAETSRGTEATVLCEDIPRGVGPEENEMAWNSSLQKLAALIE